MASPQSTLLACLGEEAAERVASARILLVGAGGIGCELLKNLVMCGARFIDIIDLDTISVSNLNRQFLFRQAHVGRPKAVVAREAMLALKPDLEIAAYHASVFEPRFNYSFIQQYAIVFNALDNIGARRHVNQLCIMTETPLVEAGTAGYLGQATVIVKGKTECYDCTPKPTPTVFPVCTIRSTPDKPIHCIVWAKYVFTRLYGDAEDEAADGNANVLSNEALRALDPRQLFDRLFRLDIQALLTMADLWRSRAPPKMLELELVEAGASDAAAIAPEAPTGDAPAQLATQRVWHLSECARRFVAIVGTLKHRRAERGLLDFDKDDDDAMQFVTAAANLRAACYGIGLVSQFDAQSMAGNIIPAIASTNAIAAALQVIDGIKLLANRLEHCHTTYIMQFAAHAGRRRCQRMLDPIGLEPPNPACAVCQPDLFVVRCNLARMSLAAFISHVCLAMLGQTEPSLMLGSRLLFESGDDAEDMSAQLPRTLGELGIASGARLDVDGTGVVVLEDESLAADAVVLVSQPSATRKRAREDDDDASATDAAGSDDLVLLDGDVQSVRRPEKRAKRL